MNKEIIILFSGNYNGKECDDFFVHNKNLYKNSFKIAYISDDDLTQKNYKKALKNVPENSLVFYKGWMLEPEDYLGLEKVLIEKNSEFIIKSKEYEQTHYYSDLYKNISQYTAKTLEIDFKKYSNIEEQIDIICNFVKENGKCLLKDFVKSEKYNGELITIDIADKKHIAEKLNQYIFFRKPEKGWILKKFMNFDNKNEYRLVYNNDKPLFGFNRDTTELFDISEFPNLNINLFLYVVDYKILKNKPKIIEIGNIQVSDISDYDKHLIEHIKQKAEYIVKQNEEKTLTF